MGTGMGRRRERDQVAEVARRRLALLEAELAGIRPQVGVDPGWVDPHDPRALEQEPRTPREPGQHRHATGAPEHLLAPAIGRRPPLRPGRPGSLHDPGELEEQRVAARPAIVRAEERPLSEPCPAPDGGGLPDWLSDRIPETLRGRTALSGRAVVGLSVLVLVVLGFVGWTTLRSGGGDAVPEAQVRTVAGAAAPNAAPTASTAAGGAGSASPPAGPSTGADVVVDVAGRVRRPGIVTLPTGSRVHEAIQRAGGARPGVSLTSINLARVLVDGEQIVVGAKGAAAAPAAGATGSSGTTNDTGSAGGTTGALVNLNTADATALDTLPGVGEVTAQKILDWRTSHGTFTSVDELLDVDGIGEKTLADIKPHVTV